METTLTGWGNLNPVRSTLVATDAHSANAALNMAGGRGIAIRGNGRSYGDQAQNSGGTTITLVTGRTITITNTTATCSGDVSIGELMRAASRYGLFVPVIPGTRHVTIGGAIANDVHGKNHHQDGSIGSHTRRITLLDGNGGTRTLTPETTPELFWASVGGMGLTGLILEAEIELIDVPAGSMLVQTSKHRHTADLLDAMKTTTDWRYSVAWLDLSGGRRGGRGILWLGEHDHQRENRHGDVRDVRLPAPRVNLVTGAATKVFNAAWWTATRTGTSHTNTERYFHPLDRVANWNVLHGNRGFHQYQFVVPFEAEHGLLRIVKMLSEHGNCSPLVVLKRLGEGNPGPLSFPMSGWTLAVDMPAGPNVGDITKKLDRIVLDCGGRHYLAKDSLATADTVRRGYPRLDEWLTVRETVDPKGIWKNDQARRLGLV